METYFKYYCDSTFNKNDNFKWQKLIDIAIKSCDFVEFNVLKKEYLEVDEINELKNALIKHGKRKNKIYSSGNCLKFKLSKKVISFIKAKEYPDWYNYYLEDISFIKNCTEMLSTITHENYVIMLIKPEDVVSLNKEGFDFVEWGEIGDI